MRIALCQTAPTGGAKESNLTKIEELIGSVSADLVVLPEMFATGYTVNPASVAEPMSGATVARMRSWATDGNKAVAGSVVIAERGRYFNRMILAMPNGTTFAYDKHHLFSFSGEDRLFTAGRERIIVTFRGVRILPLVCYDLRFAAWSYMPFETDLIIYSASWNAERIAAWDALLPARAVENQAYALGVNRVGNDSTGSYNGHSALYDFYGQRIATAGNDECVATAEIDIEALNAYRAKFRAWNDADKFEFTAAK